MHYELHPASSDRLWHLVVAESPTLHGLVQGCVCSNTAKKEAKTPRLVPKLSVQSFPVKAKIFLC